MSADYWENGEALAELTELEHQFIGGSTNGMAPLTPRRLLESQRIVWRRDYDAVVVGFILGVLCALVAVGLW